MTMSSREEFAPRDRRLNVHPLERLLSVALGACLLQSGLQRTVPEAACVFLDPPYLPRRKSFVRPMMPEHRYPQHSCQNRRRLAADRGQRRFRPPNGSMTSGGLHADEPAHVEKVILTINVPADRRGPLGARLELVSIEEDDRTAASPGAARSGIGPDQGRRRVPEGRRGGNPVRVELSYLPPSGVRPRV